MTSSDASTTAAGSGQETGSTMMDQAQRETAFATLRRQFPPEQIGKLPRGPVQLDYVGHADVTSRLLEADPEWNWEPKAKDVDPEVLAAALATGNTELVQQVLDNAPPKFDLDRNGNPVGLWIRLTVAGVTRPGYGSCPSSQSDAVKVLIGDALRNAAMRFGVALDLWAKGDRADPTRENATGSGGQAARGRSRSAGDAWENASPAPQRGSNGRANGQVSRPAADRPQIQADGDPDPDAQTYADEATQALTLASLQDIQKKAREAGKLTAIIVNPSTGGKGRLAEFIDYHRKRLKEMDDALKGLNEVATQRRISLAEVETQFKVITGKSVDDSSAAEIREGAQRVLAGAAA